MTPAHSLRLVTCSTFALAFALPRPATAAEPRIDEGYAPVTVSAANYRETPRDELRLKVNAKPTRIVTSPASAGAAPDSAERSPVYYIFAPGEGNADEMPFEQMCELLEPALAQRGFLNSADREGRLQRPITDDVLVLRVSYGTIPWRLPIVRTEQLAWRHGLRPPPKSSRPGMDVAYDHRYGGTSPSEVLTGIGNSPTPRTEKDLAAFSATRPHHLICVDAFSYAELQDKGAGATRVWTTFISAPTTAGSNLARLAPVMIRTGVDAFGGTTSGLQVHPDVHANVEIGESSVIED